MDRKPVSSILDKELKARRLTAEEALEAGSINHYGMIGFFDSEGKMVFFTMEDDIYDEHGMRFYSDE